MNEHDGTSPPPAPRMAFATRVNLLTEFHAGQSAFEVGEQPSACPHVPIDAESRFRSYYWLAGWWTAARPGVEGSWKRHIARRTQNWAALGGDDVPLERERADSDSSDEGTADAERLLWSVPSLPEWLEGVDWDSPSSDPLNAPGRYFEQFRTDLAAFDHDFRPTVPPDDHFLDAAARGWLNIPESTTQLRAEAGTVAVLPTIDPCDVCGGAGRYDTTAPAAEGQRMAVTLCLECFGRHGDHRLGPGRSVLMVTPRDVARAISHQILPFLSGRDRTWWTPQPEAQDGWDSYRRWGFELQEDHTLRRWIMGVEFTLRPHELGAVEVTYTSAPASLTMGFGGPSTSYFPLDLSDLDVRQCLVRLLEKARDYADRSRIRDALYLPAPDRDAAAVAPVLTGTYEPFIRLHEHLIGRSAAQELALEAAEESQDPEILRVLALQHPELVVRAAAVTNTHCADSTLLEAAKDSVVVHALVNRPSLPDGALEEVIRSMLMDVELNHCSAVTALIRPDFPPAYFDRVVGRIHEAGPEARARLAEAVHAADPDLRDRVHLHILAGSKRIPSTMAVLQAVLGWGPDRSQRLEWLRNHDAYKVRQVVDYATSLEVDEVGLW